ncbi:MAG: beta-ketoacyl-[acyl-carrier-protein] synthase family protein [Deltaproteobacteria bacterium]|nr:beta-ketoacyl-[acyl-carrier-protein] synthase family protein [Deltaproteobacteria bacterium]
MEAVITGLGLICAAGETVNEAMTTLYSGMRNPALPLRIKTELDKKPPVFEVASDLDKFNPGNDESRTTLLLLSALDEALAHAGIDKDYLDSIPVGVAMGTTVGCTLNRESFYRAYRRGENPGIEPIGRFLRNNPALYVARRHNFSGPAITIANACSSGTDAIGMGKSWIESGLCHMVIAGGSDELCRTTYLGFNSLLNTAPEPCRPFDKNRKGLNLGEGAGVLILESESSLKKRGAKKLAAVAGYATNSDAYHPTAPHPEGRGLTRAMAHALKMAETSPARVSFINAHGTSTTENDKVEGKTIGRLFPDALPVVSTKAFTGHTLGAAGAVEAIFSVMGLIDGKIPATIGFEAFDEACAIEPTSEVTPVKGNIAVSNSLAFGGNNSVLVLRGKGL